MRHRRGPPPIAANLIGEMHRYPRTPPQDTHRGNTLHEQGHGPAGRMHRTRPRNDPLHRHNGIRMSAERARMRRRRRVHRATAGACGLTHTRNTRNACGLRIPPEPVARYHKTAQSRCILGCTRRDREHRLPQYVEANVWRMREDGAQPVELLGDYKQRASPDYPEAVGGAVRLKGVRLSSVHPLLHTKLD